MGDLPDSKTGKGRRGGTIFTAGDMSTFESIGDQTGQTIAAMLLRRREKGTQNIAKLNKDSVSLTSDGRTITFRATQQINVEKPELLMEEMGVSELYRTTVAKATLSSMDGNLIAVFASALDQDFAGPDGVALQKSIDSFLATDQSGNY